MPDTDLDYVIARRKVDGELFRLPRHIVEASEGLALAPTQRKRDEEFEAAAAEVEAAEVTKPPTRASTTADKTKKES